MLGRFNGFLVVPPLRRRCTDTKNESAVKEKI
jgi:hypothetical protein